MTSYHEEIQRIKEGILVALRTREEAIDVGKDVIKLLTGTALDDSGPFKPLSAPQHLLLGNVLQSAVAVLLDSALDQDTSAMEYRLSSSCVAPSLPLLLDATLWLAQRGATHGGIPATLMEQIFDSQTVGECEKPFAYLESRLAIFKTPGVQLRAALTLQRACNLLMHRLSKSQNALFAGRLLIFLAKLLPLMERSGGAFHTDNTTPLENVPEGALDSAGNPVDRAFYKTFWGLQATFADPPRAAARWGETSRAIRAALDRLRAEPMTLTESSSGSALGISPKYLSGSRLLSLQLHDAAFRRHFLLQCLILFQFLEAPHASKQAWPTLRDRQMEDLKALQASVYESLAAVPEKGPQFADAIRTVLREEDSWAAWKQASCPKEAFERPDAVPPAAAASEDPLGPPFKRQKPSRDAVFGVTLGTEELDRLWNLTEDNLSALAADDRGGFKTVDQLMDPVVEEMTDVEAEGLSKSTMYSWRTLRLVSRVNLRAFVASVQAGGDLQAAARIMYPSRCPSVPEAAAKEGSEVVAPLQALEDGETSAGAGADKPGAGPEGEARTLVGEGKLGSRRDGEVGLSEGEEPGAADVEDGETDAAADGVERGGSEEDGDLPGPTSPEAGRGEDPGSGDEDGAGLGSDGEVEPSGRADGTTPAVAATSDGVWEPSGSAVQEEEAGGGGGGGGGVAFPTSDASTGAVKGAAPAKSEGASSEHEEGSLEAVKTVQDPMEVQDS